MNEADWRAFRAAQAETEAVRASLRGALVAGCVLWFVLVAIMTAAVLG